MRCHKCGGMVSHFLIAEGGRNFYRCTTGLTGFQKTGNRKSEIYLCNTVQDEQGKVIKIGTILAYMSEGRAELFKVGD